jgi:hypothetical protein
VKHLTRLTWRYRSYSALTLSTGLLTGLFLLSLSIGKVHIPLITILKILCGDGTSPTSWQTIIWQFRLPKAIAAVLAGAALAVSGLQLQTLFQNPLAGPFTLGISSGASLGVAIVVLAAQSMRWFDGAMLGSWATVIAACFGAFVVTGIVLVAAKQVLNVWLWYGGDRQYFAAAQQCSAGAAVCHLDLWQLWRCHLGAIAANVSGIICGNAVGLSDHQSAQFTIIGRNAGDRPRRKFTIGAAGCIAECFFTGGHCHGILWADRLYWGGGAPSLSPLFQNGRSALADAGGDALGGQFGFDCGSYFANFGTSIGAAPEFSYCINWGTCNYLDHYAAQSALGRG